jgi:hypothetical protein
MARHIRCHFLLPKSGFGSQMRLCLGLYLSLRPCPLLRAVHHTVFIYGCDACFFESLSPSIKIYMGLSYLCFIEGKCFVVHHADTSQSTLVAIAFASSSECMHKCRTGNVEFGDIFALFTWSISFMEALTHLPLFAHQVPMRPCKACTASIGEISMIDITGWDGLA